MTTENQGYIIDVIADLQKRLASETASNKYLRGELETKERFINKLSEILKKSDINTENLNAKIAQLQAEISAFDDTFSSQNNQITEQKETIETLRESVKIGNENYNTLQEKYESLDADYWTLKGLYDGK
jgi:chromosome segregation ATPase